MNSYYCVPDDPADVLGVTDYTVEFCSVVARDNVVATQFHAEKSGELGLALLRGFADVGAAVLTKRLIACFDVVNGRVTKAQQFQDNIDVAPAEELAQQLYADQIDEIVFYDIKASAEKRKIDLDTVRRVAHHVFVPVHRRRRHPRRRRHVRGAEGGRREDQRRLDGGAQPRDHPRGRRRRSVVSASCSSTQVKHVGVRDGIPSGYEVFIDGARLATGLDALDWVRRGEDLGAGEIVVNSIDRDGTASGYDLDITRAVADAVNVPVIASGGAGTVDHIADGLTAGGASAAIISSILYSPRLERNVGVRELKDGLAERDVPMRPVPVASRASSGAFGEAASGSQSTAGASAHSRSRS